METKKVLRDLIALRVPSKNVKNAINKAEGTSQRIVLHKGCNAAKSDILSSAQILSYPWQHGRGRLTTNCLGEQDHPTQLR